MFKLNVGSTPNSLSEADYEQLGYKTEVRVCIFFFDYADCSGTKPKMSVSVSIEGRLNLRANSPSLYKNNICIYHFFVTKLTQRVAQRCCQKF